METKKIVAVQAVLLGVICAVPAYAAFQAPTVDDCVERTGQTTEECQKMIDSFKDRKPPEEMPKGGDFQGGFDDGRAPRMMKDGEGQRPPRESGDKVASRQGQHWRLQRIVTHIEKITSFLESKDVDTSSIQSGLGTFQGKVEAANSAAESFEAARTTWQEDQTDDNRNALTEARANLQNANKEAIQYYRDTLLPIIKEALDSLR